ncbi:hypothetical protein BB559_004171 [Furculomyces boomerangus]|uniref:Arrestin-like N-terminal domain-containing protein n=1 Tax=Furculomyces boomerangus TaxID=61424 RepID=A0A2T9YGC0_9FUNG|nr:hypothetical protein BB559_004171 [Furculomyces boomerangus]
MKSIVAIIPDSKVLFASLLCTEYSTNNDISELPPGSNMINGKVKINIRSEPEKFKSLVIQFIQSIITPENNQKEQISSINNIVSKNNPDSFDTTIKEKNNYIRANQTSKVIVQNSLFGYLLTEERKNILFEPGEHTFPFNLNIPRSTLPSITTGIVSIRHCIKVILKRPSFKKPITTFIEIRVLPSTIQDFAYLRRSYHIPTIISKNTTVSKIVEDEPPDTPNKQLFNPIYGHLHNKQYKDFNDHKIQYKDDLNSTITNNTSEIEISNNNNTKIQSQSFDPFKKHKDYEFEHIDDNSLEFDFVLKGIGKITISTSKVINTEYSKYDSNSLNERDLETLDFHILATLETGANIKNLEIFFQFAEYIKYNPTLSSSTFSLFGNKKQKSDLSKKIIFNKNVVLSNTHSSCCKHNILQSNDEYYPNLSPNYLPQTFLSNSSENFIPGNNSLSFFSDIQPDSKSIEPQLCQCNDNRNILIHPNKNSYWMKYTDTINVHWINSSLLNSTSTTSTRDYNDKFSESIIACNEIKPMFSGTISVPLPTRPNEKLNYDINSILLNIQHHLTISVQCHASKSSDTTNNGINSQNKKNKNTFKNDPFLGNGTSYSLFKKKKIIVTPIFPNSFSLKEKKDSLQVLKESNNEKSSNTTNNSLFKQSRDNVNSSSFSLQKQQRFYSIGENLNKTDLGTLNSPNSITLQKNPSFQLSLKSNLSILDPNKIDYFHNSILDSSFSSISEYPINNSFVSNTDSNKSESQNFVNNKSTSIILLHDINTKNSPEKILDSLSQSFKEKIFNNSSAAPDYIIGKKLSCVEDSESNESIRISGETVNDENLETKNHAKYFIFKENGNSNLEKNLLQVNNNQKQQLKNYSTSPTESKTTKMNIKNNPSKRISIDLMLGNVNKTESNNKNKRSSLDSMDNTKVESFSKNINTDRGFQEIPQTIEKTFYKDNKKEGTSYSTKQVYEYGNKDTKNRDIGSNVDENSNSEIDLILQQEILRNQKRQNYLNSEPGQFEKRISFTVNSFSPYNQNNYRKSETSFKNVGKQKNLLEFQNNEEKKLENYFLNGDAFNNPPQSNFTTSTVYETANSTISLKTDNTQDTKTNSRFSNKNAGKVDFGTNYAQKTFNSNTEAGLNLGEKRLFINTQKEILKQGKDIGNTISKQNSPNTIYRHPGEKVSKIIEKIESQKRGSDVSVNKLESSKIEKENRMSLPTPTTQKHVEKYDKAFNQYKVYNRSMNSILSYTKPKGTGIKDISGKNINVFKNVQNINSLVLSDPNLTKTNEQDVKESQSFILYRKLSNSVKPSGESSRKSSIVIPKFLDKYKNKLESENKESLKDTLIEKDLLKSNPSLVKYAKLVSTGINLERINPKRNYMDKQKMSNSGNINAFGFRTSDEIVTRLQNTSLFQKQKSYGKPIGNGLMNSDAIKSVENLDILKIKQDQRPSTSHVPLGGQLYKTKSNNNTDQNTDSSQIYHSHGSHYSNLENQIKATQRFGIKRLSRRSIFGNKNMSNRNSFKGLNPNSDDLFADFIKTLVENNNGCNLDFLQDVNKILEQPKSSRRNTKVYSNDDERRLSLLLKSMRNSRNMDNTRKRNSINFIKKNKSNSVSKNKNIPKRSQSEQKHKDKTSKHQSRKSKHVSFESSFVGKDNTSVFSIEKNENFSSNIVLSSRKSLEVIKKQLGYDESFVQLNKETVDQDYNQNTFENQNVITHISEVFPAFENSAYEENGDIDNNIVKEKVDLGFHGFEDILSYYTSEKIKGSEPNDETREEYEKQIILEEFKNNDSIPDSFQGIAGDNVNNGEYGFVVINKIPEKENSQSSGKSIQSPFKIKEIRPASNHSSILLENGGLVYYKDYVFVEEDYSIPMYTFKKSHHFRIFSKNKDTHKYEKEETKGGNTSLGSHNPVNMFWSHLFYKLGLKKKSKNSTSGYKDLEFAFDYYVENFNDQKGSYRSSVSSNGYIIINKTHI